MNRRTLSALWWTYVLLPVANAQTSDSMQLPQDASDKVHAVSTPIIALGVALLALTVSVAVIAYINSRVPRE